MRRFRKSLLACAAGLAFAAAAPTAAFAAAPADPALIKARSHFFGFENVDQKTGEVDHDKVIISWFSVQSFAVAVRGRVFLLDSYIYRLADRPAYVPTTVPELVDLQPEAIFIGHGHGDHADNAAYIALKTGARIFGAAEHCVAMNADVDKLVAAHLFPVGSRVRCTALTTTGSAPGAEVREINALRPDVCISSFKHVHSGVGNGPNPNFPGVLVNPIRDPRVDTLFPPQPQPAIDTRTTGVGGGGAVSMFYQFTVADSDFSFVWHDTAGPLIDLAPNVLQMLRFLPKVDVELGAVVSIGETVNGVRDIGMYIQNLQPKIFYAGHSDNFNIGASLFYQQALVKQFELMNIPAALRPEIRGLHDPYDYLRPGIATFEWKDKIWRQTPPGKASPTCRF
jgi:hypothetical protein